MSQVAPTKSEPVRAAKAPVLPDGSAERDRSADAARPKPRRHRESQPLPPFHVVVLDDNDHTYEYVIDMLKAVLGYDEQRGYLLARAIDTDGRAVVYTAHKELAELKREMVVNFGTDERVATCRGSMSAVIIPAEGAGDS